MRDRIQGTNDRIQEMNDQTFPIYTQKDPQSVAFATMVGVEEVWSYSIEGPTNASI